MTNRIILAAAEVRVDAPIHNGAGTNAHPAHAWETITKVGGVWPDFFNYSDKEVLHGEFWREADEQIVVIRYPKTNA